MNFIKFDSQENFLLVSFMAQKTFHDLSAKFKFTEFFFIEKVSKQKNGATSL